MLQTYFKTAIRNLRSNKGFSLVNIGGLSIGMAAAILILLWVQNELSTDRFYQKTSRIYWMYNRDKTQSGETMAGANTPRILAPTLKQNYPEVEDAVRFRNVTFLVSVGDKRLNIQGAFTDSGYLRMFDFPLLEGNANQSLNSQYSIVLTEKSAKKFFGNEKAVGKKVTIDSTHNCIVTAVLKDLPNNTKFDFEYLLPWSYMIKIGWDDNSWTSNGVYTYTLLKPGTPQRSFDAKVKDIVIRHTKGTPEAATTEIFSQPLNRAYLYSKSDNGKLVGGPIETVKLFAIIAGLILLIACINFMNLSTARSEKRAKEVGVRKVMGAKKSRLIIQFLVESIILSFIAFIIALFIIQLSLKGFNQIVGKDLFINYSDPVSWVCCFAFILFSGILAGSYPAFLLSSFRPVKVLKGTFKKANSPFSPRKILVVAQFTFAIILIICTIIVEKQIRFGLKRDAGYNRNNLIYTFGQGEVNDHFGSIKHDLLTSGTAVSITRCANPITRKWGDGWGFKWEGSTSQDEKMHFVRLGSDADFIKTIGAKLKEGRDIDVYNYPTDSTAVMLNESAINLMHLSNPIGKVIKEVDGDGEWHIVGIIHDFILESPYQKSVNPMMILGPAGSSGYVVHIKLNPKNSTTQNLSQAEKIFKEYNPQYPFEYVFADEAYANKFNETQQTGKLAALFAILTIFISCLGLFALAAYMAEIRTKEIGVRKILGASAINITSLLSKDFLKLVMISFIISSPVAWLVMNEWLLNYTYRINIEWWIFAVAGMIAIFIALLTISFQSVKAAMANPVKSLKTQ